LPNPLEHKLRLITDTLVNPLRTVGGFHSATKANADLKFDDGETHFELEFQPNRLLSRAVCLLKSRGFSNTNSQIRITVLQRWFSARE